MFQTSIILYLQSLATEGLTGSMNAITTLGDDKLQAGIILLVLFGFSFRKGMLLTQLFMWTGIVTDGFKALFNMPRPTFVHSDIKNLQHNEYDLTPFFSPGSKSFFSGIDPDILAAFRIRNDESWGFPSGHVSSSVALWGGLASLFNKKFLYWLAAILAILVALSRMFLGRHFLGDVLGGILLAVIILCSVFIVRRYWGFMVEPHSAGAQADLLPNLAFYTFWFGIPLALGVIYPDVFGKFSGFLIGLNSAYLLLSRGDLPEDEGSWIIRTARVLISILLYFLAYGLWSLFAEITSLDSVPFFDKFMESVVILFTCILGTVKLCIRLGLYKMSGLKSQSMEPENKPD
ncbi:MAG: phosphatase PAP2 family protein [Anaerolineales bacterium]|nr:phosphatase PAP2 family protein [Anaerolineales bacterium]